MADETSLSVNRPMDVVCGVRHHLCGEKFGTLVMLVTILKSTHISGCNVTFQFQFG